MASRERERPEHSSGRSRSRLAPNIPPVAHAPGSPVGVARMLPLPLSQIAVHLRPEDNIAVAARHLQAGTPFEYNGQTLTLARRIGMGHKIALRPIRKGESVYKYGQIIGFASEDIPGGGHVHVHNVAADNFERDYAFCRDCPPPPPRA